jgi:hypothetical protein
MFSIAFMIWYSRLPAPIWLKRFVIGAQIIALIWSLIRMGPGCAEYFHHKRILAKAKSTDPIVLREVQPCGRTIAEIAECIRGYKLTRLTRFASRTFQAPNADVRNPLDRKVDLTHNPDVQDVVIEAVYVPPIRTYGLPELCVDKARQLFSSCTGIDIRAPPIVPMPFVEWNGEIDVRSANAVYVHHTESIDHDVQLSVAKYAACRSKNTAAMSIPEAMSAMPWFETRAYHNKCRVLAFAERLNVSRSRPVSGGSGATSWDITKSNGRE